MAEFDKIRSLVDLIELRAEHDGGTRAFSFVAEDGASEEHLTYAELALRTRALAARLQAVTKPGERAVLLYPPGLDYLVAYFGCLAAGLIAVPAYPPDPSRLNRSLPRLQAIIADAGAEVMLTTAPLLSMAELLYQFAPELAEKRWIATDAITKDEGSAWKHPGARAEDIAFLQYTSGSTGTPKGVVVTHGNLLSNLAAIHECQGWRRGSPVVTWIPPYHDMGLIGGILTPVFVCAPATLMSPLTFLRRPMIWLEVISRVRATLTAGPNFAYDLCVRKATPEQIAALDLSCLELALNAAEPVRPETLERFYDAFKSCGFRREASYPCYGLAEATLKVTGARRLSAPIVADFSKSGLMTGAVSRGVSGDSTRLVGCGPVIPGHELVIVDPVTRLPSPPQSCGEIWIKGPSVAKGYWRKPELSEEVFGAHRADNGEGPYLRTGDLGFLQDGELFIAGRLKDLIVIRGRNFYPQDIEFTVEKAHPSLRRGCSAAFSIDSDGAERLVVAVEVERRYQERRGGPSEAGGDRQQSDRRQQTQDLSLGADNPKRFDPAEIVEAIRHALAEEHGVGAAAIVLLKAGSIPKTSSGKIQRHACKADFLGECLDALYTDRAAPAPLRSLPPPPAPLPPPSAPSEAVHRVAPQRAFIRDWLIQRIAHGAGVNPAEIDPSESLSRYGLDSAEAVSLAEALSKLVGRHVSATVAWDYPTIDALSTYIAGADQRPESEAVVAQPPCEPVAIIGMACRFPGAADANAFWELLREGRDAVAEVPKTRWDVSAYFSEDMSAPGKMVTRWGGFIRDVDQFDALFFGISPREATHMDPQQRLLLEVAWEALEAAGQRPSALAGSATGVFVGVSNADYGHMQMEASLLENPYAGIGSATSIVANRLSYQFDFRGPSFAVDTACSSSLVAIHLACESLRRGESSLALAGGVNIILSPDLTVYFSKAGFMSPDGRCKAFDSRANGYVRGEGAGIVILKLLSKALEDGDAVHSVILGSAVNQDGRSNGLTAPNRHAQEAVLRDAYRTAGVSPGDVQYVEAHGTGTALGDPIEAAAASAVLSSGRQEGVYCAIGSVKTNIGHLEPAAGVAGLIKTALAMKLGEIPPSLHFEAANPHIPFDELPIRVQRERAPWPEGPGGRRLAGVSSFGFGGTNAHVVLASAPAATVGADRDDTGRGPYILAVSAKDRAALGELATRYAERLRTGAIPTDICYNANVRRDHHSERLAVVGDSAEELALALEEAARDGVRPIVGLHSKERLKIAFVFSGQGSQWARMGARLLESEAVFRDVLVACDTLVQGFAGWSILEELSKPEAASRAGDTAIAQPLLVALEIALASLWSSWGVEPEMVAGHSVGEIAAAHVAGVFDLESAMRLAVERGRIMQRATGRGTMALVEATLEEARAAVEPYRHTLDIAAQNDPRSVVVSGAKEAVEALVDEFRGRGRFTRQLPVNYAFHSPQMEALLDELCEALAWLRPAPARLPLFSTLLGRNVSGEELGVSYWAEQVRGMVRFAEFVPAALAAGCRVVLEVGPHPVLSPSVEACLRGGNSRSPVLAAASLRRGQDDRLSMLGTLGALYGAGVDVAWERVQGAPRPHVELPAYPWQRQRYWIDVPLRSGPAEPRRSSGALAASSASASELVREIAWEPCPAGSGELPPDAEWIIIAGRSRLGPELARTFADRDARCTVLERSDEGRELASLLSRASGPVRIVHLGALDAPAEDDLDAGILDTFARTALAGVSGLLRDVEASGRRDARLFLVTRGAQEVERGEGASVVQAMFWGFGRSVALEHPHLWGGLVDLDPRSSPSDSASDLVKVLEAGDREDQCAFRAGKRFAARLSRSKEAPAPHGIRWDPGASYLVTGGLGALGLEVARWMVEQGARRLILLGRRSLPPRRAWTSLAPSCREHELISAVLRLERMGATVHVASVDVADHAALDAFLEAYRAEQHPPIRGVVHAAGVMDLIPAVKLDEEAIGTAIRGKVLGGWNLHRALADEELDFFVGFSSLAALFGVHLAAYAASNAFLDALAQFRRASGKPALSILWGHWSDVGMAARLEAAEVSRLRGAGAISPAEGCGLLGALLAAPTAQLVVARMDWSELAAAYGGDLAPPILRHVLEGEAMGASGEDVRSSVLALSPAERPAALRQHLLRLASAQLRIPEHRIDPSETLHRIGMDSLMAMRLVAKIRSEFGVDLPLRELFDGMSIDAIADRVTGTLTEEPEAELPWGRVDEQEIGERVLSFGQERLWFLSLLEPESTVYNVPVSFRLRGALEVPILEQALRLVIDRHEVLRTAYEAEAGRPVVRVYEDVAFSLLLEDCSELDPALRQARLEDAMNEEANTPFSLGVPPLVRGRLLRLGADDHVLFVTMHHIVTDGFSMGILAQEVSAAYQSLRVGGGNPLPPLPLQYADYAAWQRQWLRGAALEAQLDYWRKRLANMPTAIDLPTDRPRPPIPTGRGARLTAVVPAPIADAARALGRGEGATMNMLLLAAFKLLLSRLSGERDLVVGTPITNRRRGELEGLIGFFVNTLVLRTQLREDATFRELLRDVRDGSLEAYAHQDVPFERLVSELQPERDMSRAPLFQVVFNMMNFPAELDIPGIEAAVVDPGIPGSKWDLTLYAREAGREIQLELLYSTDLFGPARMGELLGQYLELLRQVVTNPGQKTVAYSLVTPEARQVLPNPEVSLRREWTCSVVERFSATARTLPKRVALAGAARSVTFGELEEASGKLGGYLRSRGIGVGDVVAIIARRGISLPLAMLGVLKAGAAFTILDGRHPGERNARSLRSARPRAVLACGEAESLPDAVERTLGELGPVARLGVPEDDWTGPWAAPGLLPSDSAPGPDDMAYIAFTSGSTGTPKGIVGTHAPLAHFVDWHVRHHGLATEDRFAMLSGLGHDPLLRDIFTPLCLGATLCVPDEETFDSPVGLAAWLAREAISVVHVTPALTEMFLEAGESFPDLRYVFFGGDVLTRSLVNRLHEQAPKTAIVSFYGTTETPQGVSAHVVRGPGAEVESGPEKETIPIGLGIEGVQMLVLGSLGRLAGVGELGEICVRTPYLARGYLDEGAGDRFVSDPFGDGSGDRMYRTGDLGRYRPDGKIEFVGRADGQIKLRGFRVELAEIEAVLASAPRVRQAAVALRGRTGDDTRIVAYVVSEAGEHPSHDELRDRVRQFLPEYMVPSAFVNLERMPLGPTGKLDRTALPDVSTIALKKHVAPRNAIEELLVEIWRDVLALESLGVQDRFFDLGGHSLLATRVLAQIHDALEVELPLRSLFEAPTIEELARALETRFGESVRLRAELVLKLAKLSDEDAEGMLATGATPSAP